MAPQCLVVTDLCQTNAQGRNPIQEAQFSGVCGVNSAVTIGLPALGGCGKIEWGKGLKALNYVTSAALDETLHCADRSAAFAALKSRSRRSRSSRRR